MKPVTVLTIIVRLTLIYIFLIYMFVKFCSNDWNSIVLDMLIPRFLMLSQIDIAKDTIGNLTENSSIFKLTKESNDQTRNFSFREICVGEISACKL